MSEPNFFGATFKVGVVSARDAASCRVRVRFDDIDGLQSHWLPVLVAGSLKNLYYHLPDIGEQVACLLDVRFEEGVVLGAIYSDADRPPVESGDKTHVRFDDGTTVEYDRASHAMQISVVGPLTVVASAITLDAAQTTCAGAFNVKGLLTYQGGLAGSGGAGASAQITGDVQVSGNITATGQITRA